MKNERKLKTVLVVGASGATGRLLVDQLLKLGLHVKAIVRNPEEFSEFRKDHEKLDVLVASILNLSIEELSLLVKDCDAVASCLGHNMTWNGIFGHPRRLVTDAVRHLSMAILSNNPKEPIRFVLMNTAGNQNRDIDEPISFAQKVVIQTLRTLLPPHADNEDAADYLRTEIGQNNKRIEWSVVRPDSLLNLDEVTDYTLHTSPIRSAIFNAGQTSRINVAHFISRLVSNNETWLKWKGQMPVIYNQSRSEN